MSKIDENIVTFLQQQLLLLNNTTLFFVLQIPIDFVSISQYHFQLYKLLYISKSLVFKKFLIYDVCLIVAKKSETNFKSHFNVQIIKQIKHPFLYALN